MENYIKVLDNLYLIDTLFVNTPYFVASYLIWGEKAAIIDTGYPSTYMNVVNVVKKFESNFKELAYIIPTHVHLDHGGASGHLAREFPHATVIAHEKGAKHLVDPTKLIKSAKSVFPEEKIKKMGLPIPIDAERVVGVKGNNDKVDLGKGVELEFIYTPGHAFHHMSIFAPEQEVLFTGDAIAVKYPDFPVYIPTTPAPRFDPDLAIKSIEKLEKLDPKILLIPHFGIVKNPEEHFYMSKKKIREWVEVVGELVKNEDLSLMDVLNKMIEYVAKEAGTSPDKVPFKAQGSVYISVFGLLNYFENRQ
ncbi:MAG: MBL fold metallo-hydrolase [Candidatus Njordarchaeia archaeon]